MDVLYLHQHFATRAGAGGTRSFEFAQHLLRRGHTVTMVAQRRRAGGVDEPGRQDVDGIDLMLLGGYYTNHLGTWKRIWQFVRFTLQACALRFDARPDLVVATSTPLTIGIPGAVLARRYGVPFVFEVRDLWPEAPIQLGVVRSPLLKRVSRWLERWLYRRADVVIPLSPGMEAGVLAAGCDPVKIVTIPNASDLELFDPALRDRSLLAAFEGIDDRFVAVHAGSMGEANGLDYVVHAARELQDRGRADIAFMIVGAGGTERRLRAMVAEHGLDNVIFTGSIPRERLGAIVSSCDACVVSFADFPVLATNSPNKLFDGLSAGLPIIVNSPGWTRALVESTGAGVYVDVRDPAALASAVEQLADHPEVARAQGAVARELAEDVFARGRLATRFCDVLEHAATLEPGSGAGLPDALRARLVSERAQVSTPLDLQVDDPAAVQ